MYTETGNKIPAGFYVPHRLIEHARINNIPYSDFFCFNKIEKYFSDDDLISIIILNYLLPTGNSLYGHNMIMSYWLDNNKKEGDQPEVRYQNDFRLDIAREDFLINKIRKENRLTPDNILKLEYLIESTFNVKPPIAPLFKPYVGAEINDSDEKQISEWKKETFVNKNTCNVINQLFRPPINNEDYLKESNNFSIINHSITNRETSAYSITDVNGCAFLIGIKPYKLNLFEFFQLHNLKRKIPDGFEYLKNNSNNLNLKDSLVFKLLNDIIQYLKIYTNRESLVKTDWFNMYVNIL